MSEEWVDINGFFGYQISNLGRVRSLDRIANDKRGTNYLVKGKILTPIIKKDGYAKIDTSFAQKKNQLAVHRLVAEHFLPNPDKLSEVNHKDRNRSNNRVDNLEWTSPRENRTHSKLNSKKSSKYSGISFRKDSKRWRVRLCIDNKIKTIGNFDSESEAAKAYFDSLKSHGLYNKYVIV